MEIRQISLEDGEIAQLDPAELLEIDPDVIFVFGSISVIFHNDFPETLVGKFPGAPLVGCTTAGEISGSGVTEAGIVFTAVSFERSRARICRVPFNKMEDSFDCGKSLGAELKGEGLHSVFTLAQGVHINGSAFIDGMVSEIGSDVVLTGGLAGDDGKFERTAVILGNEISQSIAVAVGLYGESTRIAHGSFGGWQPFGPSRKVTKADHNILYELDGEPALRLYKKYLGKFADELPGSALLYPLAVLGDNHEELGLIRTILGIDEENDSLILAGEVSENGYLKLMYASTDSLVEGAEVAAESVIKQSRENPRGLALLVSCVGRKLAMRGRTEEEIEAVSAVLGEGTTIAGFYSNGEISPFQPSLDCKLHNQTMTISYFAD